MKVLAIDQGTTSTRALLLDADGRMTRLLDVVHRQHYPRPGWVEHDPEELLAAIRACLAAAGEVSDLRAAGLANQGESCLGWDAETGRAVGPVIVWQDDRTRPEVDRLRAEGAADLVRVRCGLPLDPYFSASKLGWILRENTEAQRLAAKGRLRLGTTDAFFRDRLTGRFETDLSTASRTALLDLATCDWDPTLCALFGVPIETLPRIAPSNGDLGDMSCGARRIALTASLVDQQASLYGHGARRPGDGKITFGTGAFALVLTDGRVGGGIGAAVPTIAWRRAGEVPVWAAEGGVYCAGAAVNWARSLGLFTAESEIDGFEGPSALSRGVVFVPALAGLACPHWDRAARGAWFGLSLETTPRDMVRAVLEGVALRTAEVVSELAGGSGWEGAVPIDGGLSANRYFAGFLATSLGRAVSPSVQQELTALGVGTLSAEGIGLAVEASASLERVLPGVMRQGCREKFFAAVSAVRQFGVT